MQDVVNADAAVRYAAFWQSLSVDTLDRLPEFMSPDIHFRDPFNDLHGLAAVEATFAKLYGLIDDIDVAVHDTAMGKTSSDTTIWYLRWTFAYRLRSGKNLSIEGVSEVYLRADGRASVHIDHWDAAGQVYEKFPIIGSVLRLLKRRL